MDREEFLRLCSSGEIIEHAEVFGNFYGVPRKNLEDNVDKGVSTLLVIDWQGAFKFMEMMREHVVSIFIIPLLWKNCVGDYAVEELMIQRLWKQG
ncbi:guanylate kinase [Anaplasma phagocytophilum str. ApNP]|uniref:Guanylate kinase n=1 Tax=Anaplasma phagocytophilum str. ApNP TaxID=1359153 RepID=A0A0F3NFD1_ANAPH|nr:guanylate kinase [Anaplasma phagocytophilum str. ApNP]